jgi:hypothetical protein
MAIANPFTGGSAALSDIPVELQPQLQQANRQQQMADLLLQQGMQGQPQGQMISGRYVAPSWSQQLAPIANAALGMYAGYQADKAQTDLAAALRGKQEEIMTKWATATPAEKFALGTSPYAPKALQAATWERLKPQKLGEGEVITEYDMGKGTYTPTAEGGERVAPDVRAAAQAIGIRGNPSTWNDAQTAAVRAQMSAFKRDTANKFDFSNMLGKSTIGQIGPMLETSKGGAVEAIDTANAANRVLGALNTGKALTGPAANQRLATNQVGQMLGISGTDEEVSAQSRALIQNLAKLTLQGRKGMKGQGAVSETEGALAEKAESGNINFTRGEIKQLADAALRTAKWKYQQHENMMTPLREDEPKVSRYYEVPVNPAIFEPPKPKTVGSSQTVNDALAIVRGTPTGNSQ